ncbi:MAG: hypothetical protein ACOYK8_08230 [Alphaproteobacteria bacterium]
MDDVSLKKLAQESMGNETASEAGSRFLQAKGLSGAASVIYKTEMLDEYGEQGYFDVPHEFHHILLALFTGSELDISVKAEILILLGQDVQEYSHNEKVHQATIPPLHLFMGDALQAVYKSFYYGVCSHSFREEQLVLRVAEYLQNHTSLDVELIKQRFGSDFFIKQAKDAINNPDYFERDYENISDFIKQQGESIAFNKQDPAKALWEQQNPNQA